MKEKSREEKYWGQNNKGKKIICLPKYMTGRKTLIFENIDECCEYFGFGYYFLRDLINSGKIYKDYFFDFYEGAK